MKKNKWNRDFPEVPEIVHESVLNALASLQDQEDKKVRRGRKRTMLLLAAVIAAALGTTAGAAGIFQWNEKAKEVFEAEPAVEDRLVLEEVAEAAYEEASGNGLTIRAVQTIQDSRCFYALFEITADDTEMEIDENCRMEVSLDFPGGENPFGYVGKDFVSADRQEVSNSRYYEIFGTKQGESDNDLNMTVRFTALQGPGAKAETGEALLTGEWDFTLDLHPADYVRYDIDREFDIAGCPVLVEAVELSPLSVKLICDAESVRALEEREGISLAHADVLRPMFVNGVKYTDGTVVEEEGFQTMTEGYDGTGSYVRTARFSRVIEPEKAAALLLGDQMDEIALQ